MCMAFNKKHFVFNTVSVWVRRSFCVGVYCYIQYLCIRAVINVSCYPTEPGFFFFIVQSECTAGSFYVRATTIAIVFSITYMIGDAIAVSSKLCEMRINTVRRTSDVNLNIQRRWAISWDWCALECPNILLWNNVCSKWYTPNAINMLKFYWIKSKKKSPKCGFRCSGSQSACVGAGVRFPSCPFAII